MHLSLRMCTLPAAKTGWCLLHPSLLAMGVLVVHCVPGHLQSGLDLIMAQTLALS